MLLRFRLFLSVLRRYCVRRLWRLYYMRLLFRYFSDRCRLVQNISDQNRPGSENKQHRSHGETSSRQGPVSRLQMKRGATRITSKPRAQPKVKICRRRNCSETADYLLQLCLLFVKLTAGRTLSQVLDHRSTARFAEHQLIDFVTNYFAIVFSHNFFTYK
jgi:hypothetical protein